MASVSMILVDPVVDSVIKKDQRAILAKMMCAPEIKSHSIRHHAVYHLNLVEQNKLYYRLQTLNMKAKKLRQQNEQKTGNPEEYAGYRNYLLWNETPAKAFMSIYEAILPLFLKNLEEYTEKAIIFYRNISNHATGKSDFAVKTPFSMLAREAYPSENNFHNTLDDILVSKATMLYYHNILATGLQEQRAIHNMHEEPFWEELGPDLKPNDIILADRITRKHYREIYKSGVYFNSYKPKFET